MAAPRRPITVSLPAPEAGTVENLKRSFADLCAGLVRAGLHGPNLAAALRQVADELDVEANARDAGDGVTTVDPSADPLNHIHARSFSVNYAEHDPTIVALVITAASAREFAFVLSIRDLRAMGEEMIRRAGELAHLVAKREGGNR